MFDRVIEATFACIAIWAVVAAGQIIIEISKLSY